MRGFPYYSLDESTGVNHFQPEMEETDSFLIDFCLHYKLNRVALDAEVV